MNAYDRNVAIFSCAVCSVLSFLAGAGLILGMVWIKFQHPRLWEWFRSFDVN